MPDFNPDTRDRLLQKRDELQALLTRDGFTLLSQGNRSPVTNTYLEYNYSHPDGRSAQIKFKISTTQVLLTMRSPF